MTRLLVVTTVSGTIRGFLLPFARHFRAEGWRVDAAAKGISKCPRCAEAFDRVWDIDWSRNPLDPRNVFTAVRTIRGLVQREGYDLVHVHTPVAAFVTRYALRGMSRADGPAVVYTAHGFHFHPQGSAAKNAMFLGLEKLAGRWTDYLMVINGEDHQAALKYRIVPPDRLLRTHGIGVDTEFYSPERVPAEEVAAVRRELELPDKAPLFLMIAEFIPRKRHEVAVEALGLTFLRRDAYLAFAGSGRREDEIKTLANGMGLTRRVRFLGYRSDIPALIRASTATIITSAHEGVPRSTMESLSLEVPAIGVDIRGVSELLGDGCGLLIPPGDTHALAAAMVRMIDSPAEAQEMGRKGRLKMLGSYKLENVVRAHVALYAQALQRRAEVAK